MQRRSGKANALEVDEGGGQRKTSLMVREPSEVSDIVGMHHEQPHHGRGCLRIRHGRPRDMNMMAVFDILFEFVEPLLVQGKALATGYSFKVTYTTLKFLNPSGVHDQPFGVNEGVDEDGVAWSTKLSDADRGRCVQHVKLLVQEEWAAQESFPTSRSRRHGLAGAWAHLAPGVWRLP